MRSWKTPSLFCLACLSLTKGAKADSNSNNKNNRHPFALRSRTRLALTETKKVVHCHDTPQQSPTPATICQRIIQSTPRGGNYFHDYYSKGLSIQFMKQPSHEFWWIFPFVVLVTAYATFPALSQAFDRLVLWVSDDSWLPDTPEQMNLLSNVGKHD